MANALLDRVGQGVTSDANLSGTHRRSDGLSMGTDEFDLISRYLIPLAANEAARGLADDAAVFDVPEGFHGVVSTDALVSGVHFPCDATGDVVARRALGSALSDLAAMGATPTGCLLTWGIGSDWDDMFFTQFADAFKADLATYKTELWGGDTVRAAMPFISVCVHGIGRKSDLLSRSGAQAGDGVYVSGTIGDGFLGLQAFGTATGGGGVSAYEAPVPQLALGQALAGVASACIDVSDGLAATSTIFAVPRKLPWRLRRWLCRYRRRVRPMPKTQSNSALF